MTASTSPIASEKPFSIPVWPAGKMPGLGAAQPENEVPSNGDGVVRLTDVSEPTLIIHPATATSRPAPVVIVCPGGGYEILSMNSEGSDVATWLNSLGITGMVLKYRVPKNRDGALQDIQRAVRLVHAHQKEWNVDTTRVGVLGFSAGGHLSARLSANWDSESYAAIDDADRLSSRPDFAILVYPAYLAKDGCVAPEFPVSSKMPPTLIIHSEDDAPYVPGSKIYHAALEANNVPHRFDLFPTGGHGYGLRSRGEARVWPDRCRDWLTRIQVLP